LFWSFAYTREPVNAARWIVAAAALSALAGCSAERILAVANSDAGPSFEPPQVVTGLRGDAFDVQDPAMNQEELDLYFVSATGGLNDIWVARRTSPTDPWGSGMLVTELSSVQNDEDPEVSADGLRMFLSSDRGGDGMRLYVSRRRTLDTPWEQPERVDGLGTSALDVAPAVNGTQLYLVFASQRGTAAELHLHAATRPDASAAWQIAGELTALTSTSRDTDPALYADGRGLVFASRRNASGMTMDLFQTQRSDVSASFASVVEPLRDLNTSFSEQDPWLSQNGRHILFVSDRDGRRRIYESRR
jgi:hypothetical protein